MGFRTMFRNRRSEKQLGQEAEDARGKEQDAYRLLSSLTAIRDSPVVSAEDKATAGQLIDEGLPIHREQAVRRRHAEALQEAKAAMESGDQDRQIRAVQQMRQSNAAVRSLIEART